MRFCSRTWWRACTRHAAVFSICFLASAAAAGSDHAALKPVPPDIEALLTLRGIEPSAPIYIRVFKEESELEVWKARPDGRYAAVKTYPICKWSGELGPKEAQGDHMAPEGFYGFGPGGLNPASKYHLALNVGYPNALDRALGRTGNYIMVHGQCVSVGCFAMTDDLIEEIYALARDAFMGGEERIPVHIFPFRMTTKNMRRHRTHPAYASWAPLKQAFDDFARTYEPPRVATCDGKYVVNPLAPIDGGPKDACPARIGKLLAAVPAWKQQRMGLLHAPLVADGPKTRNADTSETGSLGGFGSISVTIEARTPTSGGRRSTAAQSYDNGALTPLLNRR